MNNERTARINVEITEPNAERDAEVSIEVSGDLNALLNGLAQLNAHFLADMIEDFGKDMAMSVYAAVQVQGLKEAGIDPEEEMRADALRTLATIGRIFASEDPEEEAEQHESV